MDNNFTAVFEQDGDWWIGYVEELPGANTQGRTLEEARENLKEAVALVLEANRELAERQIAGKTVGHGASFFGKAAGILFTGTRRPRRRARFLVTMRFAIH